MTNKPVSKSSRRGPRRDVPSAPRAAAPVTPPAVPLTATDAPPVPEFPVNLQPLELLEILVTELRPQIASVEGWAQVIARDDNLEALSLDAAEAIPAITASLAAFLDSAGRYLETQRRVRAADQQPGS